MATLNSTRATESVSTLHNLAGIISKVGTLGVQNLMMIEGAIAQSEQKCLEPDALDALRVWSIDLQIAIEELTDTFNKEHEQWQAIRASEAEAKKR